MKAPLYTPAEWLDASGLGTMFEETAEAFVRRGDTLRPTACSIERFVARTEWAEVFADLSGPAYQQVESLMVGVRLGRLHAHAIDSLAASLWVDERPAHRVPADWQALRGAPELLRCEFPCGLTGFVDRQGCVAGYPRWRFELHHSFETESDRVVERYSEFTSERAARVACEMYVAARIISRALGTFAVRAALPDRRVRVERWCFARRLPLVRRAA